MNQESTSTPAPVQTQQPATVQTVNPWITSPEDQKDIIFPRAKIFQGTPSEFEQYPNAKHGMIINHITGEELKGQFLPFLKFKQYAKFNSRNSSDPSFDKTKDPGALIWITTDHNDPRVAETQFGESGERPTAIEFMNFMSIFDGQEFPIVVPFAKTSYKTGKRLLSMLAMSTGVFKRKFKLSTLKQQKDGMTFYIFEVAMGDAATPEESAKAAELYAKFSSKSHEIKTGQDKVDWE